jgi:transcriptional antiterminator NusG
MGDEIFRVLVPMENEIEYKDGKRKVTKKKVFPGYVLVEMMMNDRSWYVVRNTPGITGFVGSGSKPTPLTEAEVKNILKSMGLEEAKTKINVQIKQAIRIRDGAFEGWTGIVSEINEEKGKLKALVNIFGRETPVELDFEQIETVE